MVYDLSPNLKPSNWCKVIMMMIISLADQAWQTANSAGLGISVLYCAEKCCTAYSLLDNKEIFLDYKYTDLNANLSDILLCYTVQRNRWYEFTGLECGWPHLEQCVMCKMRNAETTSRLFLHCRVAGSVYGFWFRNWGVLSEEEDGHWDRFMHGNLQAYLKREE
jgi:hypothetical protein